MSTPLDEVTPNPVEGGWIQFDLAAIIPPTPTEPVEGGWIQFDLAAIIPPTPTEPVEGGWIQFDPAPPASSVRVSVGMILAN